MTSYGTRHYCVVTWLPEDVQILRPDWTLLDCATFLAINETRIRSRLIELGWDVIESMLPRTEV